MRMALMFANNGVVAESDLDIQIDAGEEWIHNCVGEILASFDSDVIASLEKKNPNIRLKQIVSYIVFITVRNALDDRTKIPDLILNYIARQYDPKRSVIARKITSETPCARLCNFSDLPVETKRYDCMYILVAFECMRVFGEDRNRTPNCKSCCDAKSLYISSVRVFLHPEENNICCQLCEQTCLAACKEWFADEKPKTDAFRLSCALRTFGKMAEHSYTSSDVYSIPKESHENTLFQPVLHSALLESSTMWAAEYSRHVQSLDQNKSGLPQSHNDYIDTTDTVQQNGTTPGFHVFVEQITFGKESFDMRKKQNAWIKRHIFSFTKKWQRTKPDEEMDFIDERYMFLLDKMLVNPYFEKNIMHDIKVHMRLLLYMLFPKKVKHISSEGLRLIWSTLLSDIGLWESHKELVRFVIAKLLTDKTISTKGDSFPSILLWKVIMTEFTRLKKTTCECSTEVCNFCSVLQEDAATNIVPATISLDGYGSIEQYAIGVINDSLENQTPISINPPFHNLELLDDDSTCSSWNEVSFSQEFSGKHILYGNPYKKWTDSVYVIQYIFRFALDQRVSGETALEIFSAMSSPMDNSAPVFHMDVYSPPNDGTKRFYKWLEAYETTLSLDTTLDHFATQDYTTANDRTNYIVGRNMPLGDAKIVKPIYGIVISMIGEIMKNKKLCVAFEGSHAAIKMNNVLEYAFAVGNSRAGRLLRRGEASEMPIFMSEKKTYFTHNVKVCRLNPVFSMRALLKTHGIVDPNLQMLPYVLCYYKKTLGKNAKNVSDLIENGKKSLNRSMKFVFTDEFKSQFVTKWDELPMAVCRELGFPESKSK